jgi:nucleoside-diphosphate-sugar epimerase
MSAGCSVYAHSSSDSNIAISLPAYDGVTHVFHLAGRTFVPDSWRDPSSFYQTNVQGTVTVMEFCRKQKTPVTVLSSYVYGIPQRLPIDEEHPVSAVNPYSHTKILAEEVVRFYATHFGVRVCIVRPFNLYGHGQDSRFLIPQLIHDCLDSETSTIEVADLSPRRDYLHVQDLVALLMMVMRSQAVGTYNAGSGVSVSVEELASRVRDYAGTNKPIVGRGETRRNEIPDVVADISRANSSLGWSPRISLSEGIRDLVLGVKAKPA